MTSVDNFSEGHDVWQEVVGVTNEARCCPYLLVDLPVRHKLLDLFLEFMDLCLLQLPGPLCQLPQDAGRGVPALQDHPCSLSGDLELPGNVLLPGIETNVQSDERLAEEPQPCITVLIQHGLVSDDGHLTAMQVLHQLLERGVVVAASSSGAAAGGGGGGARVDLTESVAGRL